MITLDNVESVGERDPEFLQEVWGLFGVGCFILCLRFAIRIRTVGLRGLQGDDAFAFLLLVFYTGDAVTVTLVYFWSTNVEGSVQLKKGETFSDEVIAQLVAGSKAQSVAWFSYTALIWCLKGTMLCFFKRMTMGLWQQRLVNWLAVICVITYCALVLTIFLSCVPFHLNWQVIPDPGERCTFKKQNFIVTTVLNVCTDAGIFAIPFPLLWKLNLPKRKKIVIGVLLSSGVFVIIAALIRVVSTLIANPSALNINRWGVRETIVGIIAVNVPILRPIFSLSFWTCGPRKINSTPGPGSRNWRPPKAVFLSDLTTQPTQLTAPNRRSGEVQAEAQANSEAPAPPANEIAIDDPPVAPNISSTPVNMGSTPANNAVVVSKMFHVSREATDAHRPIEWKGGGTSNSVAFSGENAV